MLTTVLPAGCPGHGVRHQLPTDPIPRQIVRRMEGSMKSITRTVALTLGLVILLNITPSWGQPVCVSPGCNPTVSDANSNTAGGTSALSHLAVGGVNNTAFGRFALQANTTGVANTASGVNALFSNTTGTSN